MIYKISASGGYTVKGAIANQAIMYGLNYCQTCQLDLRGIGIMELMEHEGHKMIKKYPGAEEILKTFKK